jgi:hypothetical protein
MSSESGMESIVHERIVSLEGDDGQTYALVRVHAEQVSGSTWEGWIEFLTETGQRVVTDRETTQPSRDAVAYWATGLEPVYLEGALVRAVAALRVP